MPRQTALNCLLMHTLTVAHGTNRKLRLDLSLTGARTWNHTQGVTHELPVVWHGPGAAYVSLWPLAAPTAFARFRLRPWPARAHPERFQRSSDCHRTRDLAYLRDTIQGLQTEPQIDRCTTLEPFSGSDSLRLLKTPAHRESRDFILVPSAVGQGHLFRHLPPGLTESRIAQIAKHRK